MKLIERNTYLQELIDVVGTPDIKVITGIRRSGKSKLLQAFLSYIKQNDSTANVIHIDFNLLENEKYAEYHSLYDFVKSQYKADVNNYLLIDEIQNCDGFEKAINALHASEQFDIYITGSNAFLLSSDLATLFTGRTIEIKVYPFSFAEFMQYYEYSDIQSAFDTYVELGGMAGAYLYTDSQKQHSYVADVFNTLILRDVRQKYKIRNALVMDRLSNFMMDNISNLSSVRNITSFLKNNGLKVDDKTIGNYIKYLSSAFLFYPVKRYDIKGKRYLASQEKHYLADHAFRFSILGTRNMDFGRVYENIVAIELMRRGYDVYVGCLYKKEIDFVATKQSEKIYIQVSDNISDEATFNREVDSLLKIKDAYPKLLIARTRHQKYQYEGIEIIDLPNWLLNISE